MINDKKIEEAARNYCNNRYPASQDAPFIAEGFRKGARWAIHEFLKNLWHPAIEKPKRSAIIYCFTIKTKKKNVLKLMSSIQRLGIATLKTH